MVYTAPKWVNNAVFYQIFIDRFANGDQTNDPPGVAAWSSPPTRDNFFGGDLQGILNHLPYLEKLGITALYLTPIFKARSNHKYDTNDYLTIDPSFGTKQLFRHFIDVAHSKGMRIVLDAVFNHCGDSFWAFKDLKLNGVKSKYRDWFYATTLPIQQEPPNYQTCGGVASLPKLNVMNPEVQKYLLKVSSYWLNEFGIDGWRLDVPWKVNIDFWRTFREVVKQINPEAYIVGEVWRDPTPWLGGDICDGVMNYLLRECILDYCVRDTMDAEDFHYESSRLMELAGPSALYQLNLLGSHDTARILTICNNNIERTILAMTILFTSIGTPMIYYGDEIGISGENDPDCRRCMIWDENYWNSQLLKVYRLLINARINHPALRYGNFEKLMVFNGIYAYRRYLEDDESIIIINPREERRCINIHSPNGNFVYHKWRDIFTGKIIPQDENILKFDIIPSYTAFILFPEKYGTGEISWQK